MSEADDLPDGTPGDRAPSPDERRARIEAGVRAVREGHGANCSSIGSVIDTLFASAVLGGTIFAAVVASLGREKVTVVGPPQAAQPTGRVAGAPQTAADEPRGANGTRE